MTATITSSKTMWKHAGTLTDKLFFLVFEVEKTVCRLMGEGWGVSRKRVGLGGAIRPLSLGSHILKSSVEQSGGCHRVFFLWWLSLYPLSEKNCERMNVKVTKAILPWPLITLNLAQVAWVDIYGTMTVCASDLDLYMLKKNFFNTGLG